MLQRNLERIPITPGLTHLQQVRDERRLNRLVQALDRLTTGQYESWDGFFRMLRFDSEGNRLPTISYTKSMGFWVGDQTVDSAELREKLEGTGISVEQFHRGIISKPSRGGIPLLDTWQDQLKDLYNQPIAQRQLTLSS